MGSTLTAVTVAGGKLFVADRDRHLVHALDAATGKPAWQFMVGGRVDSPPTFASGTVLFGDKVAQPACVPSQNDETLIHTR